MYISDQGRSIEGNICNYKYSGFARYVYLSGKIFEGYYYQDVPAGESKLFTAGQIEYSKYVNDEKIEY